MFNQKSKTMKKSSEIVTHLILWVLFVLLVFTYCKWYLLVNPEAPLARHLNYVVFLELVMGIIFFYTAFFGIRLTKGMTTNQVILAAVLALLLLIFAYPAFSHGFWQVMSSIIPHVAFILLAVIFRKLSDSNKLTREKQII